MNFNSLTEEEFNRMAEQLVTAWHTLAWVSKELEGHDLPSIVFESIHLRQCSICSTLEQDPDRAPKWPPVSKWQVGLTQYRTIEYSATVEVEAAGRDEAKKKAFEAARKDAEHGRYQINWAEGSESRSAWERHDHERELDDDVWCCDEIND